MRTEDRLNVRARRSPDGCLAGRMEQTILNANAQDEAEPKPVSRLDGPMVAEE